ncbi:hypothetical protein C5167_015419 [Papaver somniferum]|uniref:Uncharacterized protein n=1 Tax=Papaver somniferum TaxID=3469 RepID=A0A4Y7J601_PAPSO|nr:hypothetical protein C5167_015419 [Papaver somniferum]
MHKGNEVYNSGEASSFDQLLKESVCCSVGCQGFLKSGVKKGGEDSVICLMAATSLSCHPRARAREAGEINKSLLTLWRCINGLVEHSRHNLTGIENVKVAREKNGVYVLHKRFVQEEAEIKVRLVQRARSQLFSVARSRKTLSTIISHQQLIICVENAAVSISVTSFSHSSVTNSLFSLKSDLENRFTPRLVIPEIRGERLLKDTNWSWKFFHSEIRGERLLKDTNWSWKFFHSEKFGLAACIKINCATTSENWYVKSVITQLRDS